MKKILILLYFFFIFGATLFSTGWTDERIELQKKIQDLKNDLETFDLISTLQLTRSQIEEILKIAKEAAPFYLQADKVEERLLPNYEEVLEKFLEEDLIGNGFSPEVEKKTASFHRQEIVLKKQFCDGVNRFEDRVMHLLNEEQQHHIENYTPNFIPKSGKLNNRGRRDQEVQEYGYSLMNKIRKMSAPEYQEKKKEITDRIIRIYNNIKKGNALPFDPENEKKRLSLLLDKVRSLSEKDFETQKETIFKDLVPGGEFRKIHQEMKKIHAYKYGEIGNIGRFLITPRAIPILEAFLKRGDIKEK